MNDQAKGAVDSAYVRELGAFEQGLDAMETAAAACHIVRVITYEGTLDPGLFERALHNMLERRPIVHTRIVRPPGETPYFARTDEWPNVTVVERRDDDHWRAEFEHQLSRSVTADGEPLLRATALTGDGCGEVVLSCHHAACDGRSLTAFCRDLAHEYEWLLRGEPGDPNAVTGIVSPPLDDLVPVGLTGASGEKVMSDYFTTVKEYMTSPPGFFMEVEPEGPPGRHLLAYKLPPPESEALATLARANGATIGGALSAAMLRAGLDLGVPDAEDTVGLLTNIDLRPYLREAIPVVNMGSYAASAFTVHDGLRTRPFWEVARNITEQVKAKIDSLEAFCSALLAKSGFEQHRDGALPKMWPQFMLANLGRMDLPEPHETFRVKSIHGGSPIFGTGPFFFCGVVGRAGSLMIDVNYLTPITPDKVARQFGEALFERLLIESGAAAAHSGPD